MTKYSRIRVMNIAKTAVVIAFSGILGACTTTKPDDYNVCALGYSVLGLGLGLASSGTGAVFAGTAVGAGLGISICDEEWPKPEEPEVIPVEIPTAMVAEPEPVDNDGDGVLDGFDSCLSTPPGVKVDLDGCAEPVVLNEKLLNFKFGKADLPANAAEVLASVLAAVKQHSDLEFEISGHTDSVGPESFNQILSKDRAAAVEKFLVANGVDASRLIVIGHGESMPIADNETRAGRASNRRVEVHLLDD